MRKKIGKHNSSSQDCEITFKGYMQGIKVTLSQTTGSSFHESRFLERDWWPQNYVYQWKRPFLWGWAIFLPWKEIVKDSVPIKHSSPQWSYHCVPRYILVPLNYLIFFLFPRACQCCLGLCEVSPFQDLNPFQLTIQGVCHCFYSSSGQWVAYKKLYTV